MKCIVMAFCAILSLSVGTSFAQNNNEARDVSGRVASQEGEPIPFSNVVLLALPDSAFISGSISVDDGTFSLSAPTGRSALLRVSCIGYESVCVDLADFNGQVTLRNDDKLIDEVTVKRQRPKTKLTGNSMVTSIEGSVLEKSGNAMEMLAKVPGMTLNGDDLEVLGKGAPVFYVNGRKLQDLNELKRLSSEEILDVEVINNPGSQYDATVAAVVRIRTRKTQGSGLGFDLNLEDSQDLKFGYADPDLTLKLRYRHNSLDLFGSVNYYRWDHVSKAVAFQEMFLEKSGDILAIRQENHLRNDWRSQSVVEELGFNLQMSDNHSVGARLQHSGGFDNKSTSDQQTFVSEQYGDAAPALSRCDSHENGKTENPYDWSGNAYYNGRVGNMGIDLNVDFRTFRSRENSAVEEERQSVLTEIVSTSPSSSHMVADKLVLSYPLGAGLIQAGTEMSFVSRNSSYSIEGVSISGTDSEVTEDNVALFAEYAYQSESLGALSLGLRFEHVGLDFVDHLDDSNSLSRTTNGFFPSFSWTRQFGSWQAALSYSFMTQRPEYWRLSDAVTYVNAYTLQQGDPTLENAKIQQLGANLRWKVLNFAASCEHRKGEITQWSYIFNDEGVIVIKDINLDVPMRKLSLYLSAAPTIGVYSPNWMVGMDRSNVKNTLADPRKADKSRDVKYRKPLWIAQANNAFRFGKSWQLEGNLLFVSKGDVSNFRLTGSTCRLDFVAQKCWLPGDALCLRAKLSDALDRTTRNVEMDCGYYVINQENAHNRQRLTVSLRYTFNNASQSKYKGTGAGRDAASRLNK